MTEMLSMWDEPADQITAERAVATASLAEAAVAPLWPYLAESTSLADFDARLEVARPNLLHALATVGVPDAPMMAVRAAGGLRSRFQADLGVRTRREAADAAAGLLRAQALGRPKVTCPRCHGQGSTLGEDKCWNCHGTGKVKADKTSSKTAGWIDAARAAAGGGGFQSVHPDTGATLETKWRGDEIDPKSEGVVLDAFTASMLVQVHDALNPANQAHFEAMPLLAAVDFGWKLVNRHKSGSMVGSLLKGAPFAGYKDFEACVAANQDKDDPEAYCGKIKHQVEDNKSSALTAAAPWTPEGGNDSDPNWFMENEYGKQSTHTVDGVKVHTFASSGQAYNESQTNPEIGDGDILLVPSEGLVGILNQAWPIAVAGGPGEFHTLGPGHTMETIEGGQYAHAAQVALSLLSKHGAKEAFNTTDTNPFGGPTGPGSQHGPRRMKPTTPAYNPADVVHLHNENKPGFGWGSFEHEQDLAKQDNHHRRNKFQNMTSEQYRQYQEAHPAEWNKAVQDAHKSRTQTGSLTSGSTSSEGGSGVSVTPQGGGLLFGGLSGGLSRQAVADLDEVTEDEWLEAEGAFFQHQDAQDPHPSYSYDNGSEKEFNANDTERAFRRKQKTYFQQHPDERHETVKGDDYTNSPRQSASSRARQAVLQLLAYEEGEVGDYDVTCPGCNHSFHPTGGPCPFCGWPDKARQDKDMDSARRPSFLDYLMHGLMPGGAMASSTQGRPLVDAETLWTLARDKYEDTADESIPLWNELRARSKERVKRLLEQGMNVPVSNPRRYQTASLLAQELQAVGVNESAYGAERYQHTPAPKTPDWIHDEWGSEKSKATQQMTDNGTRDTSKRTPFADTLTTTKDVRKAALDQQHTADQAHVPAPSQAPGSNLFGQEPSDDFSPNTRPVTTRPRVQPAAPPQPVDFGGEDTETQMGAGGGFDMGYAPEVATMSGDLAAPGLEMMQPSVEQMVAARVARIAARVRTDNPDLSPDQVQALATQVVVTYPEIVRTAGPHSGTCPVCYRENLTLVNGRLPSHKDTTREGSPRCEGSGMQP